MCITKHFQLFFQPQRQNKEKTRDPFDENIAKGLEMMQVSNFAQLK